MQLFSTAARTRPAVAGFNVGGATDIGVHRTRNEDQFLIAEIGRLVSVTSASIPLAAPADRALLLAVADGLGGMGHGDLASRVALEAMIDHVASRWSSHPNVLDRGAAEDQLRFLLRTCEERVVAAGRALGPAAHGMATTLTVAFVIWPELYVLHCGDSRCYLGHRGGLALVTNDHTLARQLRANGEEPLHNLDHVLVNCVGGQKTAAAEIHQRRLERSDVVVLTTDGVTRVLTAPELGEIVKKEARAEAAARRIVQESRRRHSPDNATAVVAKF